MDKLASLLENCNSPELRARLAQGIMDPGSLMPDPSSFGQRRSKAKILADFENMRRSMSKQQRAGMVMATMQNNLYTKGSSSRMDFAKLRPILINELQAGSVHRGKVLVGTLIVDPMLISGVNSVLEDDSGTATSVAFYNYLPEKSQRCAEAVFPKGARLRIAEPFYKIGASGPLVVRVDDPQDIAFDTTPESADIPSAPKLKDMGNASFAEKDFEMAGKHYSEALAAHPTAEGLATLLANRSQCALRMGTPDVAWRDAELASVLAPANAKAVFRAAIALEQLGRRCAGIAQCTRFFQAGHSDEAVRKLHDRLELSANDINGSLWENDVQSPIRSQAAPGSDHKAIGNSLFKTADYAGASSEYGAGIAALLAAATPPVEVLLANRAACHLRRQEWEEAVADASRAVWLSPSAAKAWARRAEALCELGSFSAAATAARTAVACDAMFGEAEDLLRRADGACAARAELASTRPQVLPFDPRESEKLRNEFLQEGKLSGAELTKSNLLLTLAGTNLVDNSIPDFASDFETECGWPDGVSATKAAALLRESYETAKVQKMVKFSIIDPNIEKDNIDPAAVIQRLNEISEESIAWFESAPIGHVRERRTAGYTRSLFHSFSNVAHLLNPPFTPGGTHVSIGFVDLGTLMNWRPLPCTAPVKFVGYELSPYAVAKTGVIVALLRARAPIDVILQIWYSSGWSIEALRWFRRAVLDDAAFDMASAEVRRLILHWRASPTILLSKAYEKWLETHDYKLDIALFARPEDRRDMCRYIVTGALLQCDVGSITMFDVPREFGERSFGETVYWAAPFVEVAARLKREKTYLPAVISYLRDGITALRANLVCGALDITLHCCSIVLGNTEALAEIKMLEPSSIDWSNILDYYPTGDFHRLARACSGPSTRHWGCAMNWIAVVKGASVIDYTSGDERRAILERAEVHSVEHGRSMDQSGVLKLPLTRSPHDTAVAFLREEFASAWCCHFFTDSRDYSVSLEREPFARNWTNLRIVWEY